MIEGTHVRPQFNRYEPDAVPDPIGAAPDIHPGKPEDCPDPVCRGEANDGTDNR